MSDHDERWVLDHLIGMCRDEEQTLRFAATHVADGKLRALFGELAEQRAQFANELLPHARRLGGGGAVIAEGTWQGALHRRWMAFRDSLMGHSERAMLSEAQKGEENTVKNFEEALGGMLPPTVRDLVEAQHAQAQAGRDRLRSMMTP
jgi:uncharacterized protein (TIGR02284 family)